MPTLLDPHDREKVLARLDALPEDRVPQWGTLTAPRMLCHLADSLRIAFGDAPCRDRSTLVTRTLLKWLVIHTGFEAPPGKVQTVREMLATAPGDFAADRDALARLVMRFGTEPPRAPHPAFGPLGPSEWGRLAWKHVDHHFRQFGL